MEVKNKNKRKVYRKNFYFQNKNLIDYLKKLQIDIRTENYKSKKSQSKSGVNLIAPVYKNLSHFAEIWLQRGIDNYYAQKIKTDFIKNEKINDEFYNNIALIMQGFEKKIVKMIKNQTQIPLENHLKLQKKFLEEKHRTAPPIPVKQQVEPKPEEDRVKVHVRY